MKRDPKSRRTNAGALGILLALFIAMRRWKGGRDFPVVATVVTLLWLGPSIA